MTKFEAIHSGNHFIKHNKPLISEECASLPVPQQLWQYQSFFYEPLIQEFFSHFLACYDDQQRDWRFHNEVYAAQARAQFTRKWLIQQKLKCAAPYRLLTSDLLSCNTHDQMIMDHTIKHMRELYHPIGANPDFESVPWTFYLFGYNNYPAFARFQYNQ